ncbi:alcohol dehydrogenase catalytic domain-containing protein [Actinoalloteichus caeruleus]|uniref:alcohol dehydrogenase catalytic domain-containing protein n=1 Tax=Actinoalloteichus cyanogriseus TaxID=2893586 RepID=UPI003BB8771E
MKATVISSVGEPWRLAEIPTPSAGPGEVLVRVRASGICLNDVLASRGIIPFPSTAPAVPGHEAAGEVVEVGAGVTSRRPGDRVGVPWIQGTCGRCAHCSRDPRLSGHAAFACVAPAMTGFTAPGGQAEYVVAPASGTVLLPDDLDFELAAPMLCAGYTALSALHVGGPRQHERVAVVGIGGMGHLAVQFAASAGFETIAVTRSADKRGPARDLGAALAVADADELAGAGGADVILITAPSYGLASECLRGLRPGGRLVLAGIDGRTPFSIEPDLGRPFFAQRQQVLGATHEGTELLTEALRIVADGQVEPRCEVFPSSRISEAVEAVERGSVRFRAVVTY